MATARPTVRSCASGGVIAGGRASWNYKTPEDATFFWPPEAACSIPLVGGVGSPIHPKVLDTGDFGGYRYWMAFTPYPGASDTLENPSVVASNDGDTWFAPATNPIEPAPVGAVNGGLYNSDTHLALYGGVLYLFWRKAYHSGGANSSPVVETLYYRTTYDGVSWSSATQFHEEIDSISSGVLLSPCVSRYDNKWLMWSVRRDVSPYRIERITADALTGEWSTRTPCIVPGLPFGRNIWHIDVCRIPGGWACLIGDSGSPRAYWLSYSIDGIEWMTAKQINTTTPNAYRGSIAPSGAGFDCWLGDWDARTIRRLRINDPKMR